MLIEGARRVGKSTLAIEFARNEYESFILIDFANITPELSNLVERHITDLDYFFNRLQLLSRVNLVKRRSVIIFDEVQLQPLARQAIKYLVADGRYDYIETGSLISIKKNVKDIVIPSEEDSFQLFPMDYEEFLWAKGDEVTFGLLRQAWNEKMSLGDDVNRRLLRDFRLYMLVGGMPQAVESYLETNNFYHVDSVKRRILKLYIEDFEKIDSTGKAKTLFQAIPAELSNKASHYQSSTIIEGTSSKQMNNLLTLMAESMTVNIAYRCNDPHVGMRLNSDFSRYKIYLGDTGLFVSLAFWDKDFTENIIYEKLLSDKLSANLGYVYENMVAQLLRSVGSELFYYTFLSKSNHIYEVDFLLSRNGKLCPVEVKSSGYKTHKSLDEFSLKFSSRIGGKYLVYTKDYRRDGDMEYVPVYFTPFL